MIYNSNMGRTALAGEANRLLLKNWKTGNLAWPLAWVSILLAILAIGVSVWVVITGNDPRSLLTHQTLNPFITITFAIIGALVASRHPGNSTGWIFVVVGILSAMNSLTAAVRVYGTGTSPVYALAVWMSNWIWILVGILPITFVLLVFPDGHLPTPRWRLVAWSVAIGLVMVILPILVHPGLLTA